MKTNIRYDKDKNIVDMLEELVDRLSVLTVGGAREIVIGYDEITILMGALNEIKLLNDEIDFLSMEIVGYEKEGADIFYEMDNMEISYKKKIDSLESKLDSRNREVIELATELKKVNDYVEKKREWGELWRTNYIETQMEINTKYYELLAMLAC